MSASQNRVTRDSWKVDAPVAVSVGLLSVGHVVTTG
jgi:hypothetical protein